MNEDISEDYELISYNSNMTKDELLKVLREYEVMLKKKNDDLKNQKSDRSKYQSFEASKTNTSKRYSNGSVPNSNRSAKLASSNYDSNVTEIIQLNHHVSNPEEETEKQK